MYKIPYLIIKKKLQAIPELRIVDLDMQQDSPRTKGSLTAAPAALIKLLPMETNSLSRGVQEGVLSFEIRCISDTTLATDKRMTYNQPINHYELVDHVFKALDNHSGILSEADGFTDLEDTENDQQVLGTMERTNIEDDHTQGVFLKTTQRFSCYVKIDTNKKKYTKHEGATLDIQSTEV